MERPSPLIWIFLFLILILPTAAGRVLLDLAGGLILIFFTISLIIAGLSWLAWKNLNAKMSSGSMMSQNIDFKTERTQSNIYSEASNATIDIIAKDPGEE